MMDPTYIVCGCALHPVSGELITPCDKHKEPIDPELILKTKVLSDEVTKVEDALADLAQIHAGEKEGLREGTVTEHRRGNYFLTVIEWDDGHREVEVHYCDPRPIVRSCDPKDIERFKKEFEKLASGEDS